MLNYGNIISNMRTLGNVTEDACDIMAVGGTGLVLRRIKDSTYDVDFIVEEGDTMRFEIDYKRHCGGMIDVPARGECFGIILPNDYRAQSTYIDTFGNVTLRALSIIDVIITKSTRSEPKDIAYINLCIGRVSAEDVLK